jgi:hypothetical protein
VLGLRHGLDSQLRPKRGEAGGILRKRPFIPAFDGLDRFFALGSRPGGRATKTFTGR